MSERKLVHRYEHGVYLREMPLTGAAATLIFIHGLGESGLGFEALMEDERLARWARLAPDLPGYGKSPWRDAPPSLEEHARFLADWIVEECLGKSQPPESGKGPPSATRFQVLEITLKR